jgi:hypothetical protein
MQHAGNNPLWFDIPTPHTVVREGRKVRVFTRCYEECMGGGTRLVTHRSEREKEQVRRKHYNNVRAVNILSWTEVQPWEIGQ